MFENQKSDQSQSNFYLNKWFLDFIGEGGEAMIFYAAKLTWRAMSVPYTSWLYYEPSKGVSCKSGFRKVQMPEKNYGLITWADSKFGLQGEWKSLADQIQERLFDSEEGYLDWNCFQPASKVEIRINDRMLEGNGYAEQLILTVPPWKIPMDELRWGRFRSAEDHMVWIEIKEKENQKWLWLNGERFEDCIIRDDHISLVKGGLRLKLDKGVVLESERKIYSVVENMVRFIPGFNKLMPMKFLMSEEVKWLSRGILQKGNDTGMEGMAIHELVKFNSGS